MKKTFIILSLFLITYTVKAQSIILNNATGNVSNGSILSVNGSASTSTVYLYMDLINATANPIDVKVRKQEISVITGTENTFCLDQCYPYDVDTSYNFITIDAYDTSYNFVGEYLPHENEGTSTIRYTIYLKNNLNDTVSITVHYVTALGIINPTFKSYDLSNASPNPANEYTDIRYTLPKDSKVSKIVLRNLLGQFVGEHTINPLNSNLSLSLSSYEKGVYFYSLVIDDFPVISKKLIIR